MGRWVVAGCGALLLGLGVVTFVMIPQDPRFTQSDPHADRTPLHGSPHLASSSARSNAPATASYLVLGKVIDLRTAKPLAATLATADGRETFSSPDGRVRLAVDGVPGETLDILVEATGYKPLRVKTALPTDPTLDLGQLSLVPLTALRVRWDRALAPETFSIIVEPLLDGTSRQQSLTFRADGASGEYLASEIPPGEVLLRTATEVSRAALPRIVDVISAVENEAYLDFVDGAVLHGTVQVDAVGGAAGAFPCQVRIGTRRTAIATQVLATDRQGTFHVLLPLLESPMFVEASGDAIESASVELSPGWHESPHVELRTRTRRVLLVDVSAIVPRPRMVTISVSQQLPTVWEPPVDGVVVDAGGVASYRVDGHVGRGAPVAVAVAGEGIGIQVFEGVDLGRSPVRLTLHSATARVTVRIADAAAWGPLRWGVRAMRRDGSRITAATAWDLGGCVLRGEGAHDGMELDGLVAGRYELWLEAETGAIRRIGFDVPVPGRSVAVGASPPARVVSPSKPGKIPDVRQVLARYGDRTVVGRSLSYRKVGGEWMWEPLVAGEYIGRLVEESSALSSDSAVVGSAYAAGCDEIACRAGETTTWLPRHSVRRVAMTLAIEYHAEGVDFFCAAERAGGGRSRMRPGEPLQVRVATEDRIRVFAEYRGLEVSPRLVASREIAASATEAVINVRLATVRPRAWPQGVAGCRLAPAENHSLFGEEAAEVFIHATIDGKPGGDVLVPVGVWTVEILGRAKREVLVESSVVELDLE